MTVIEKVGSPLSGPYQVPLHRVQVLYALPERRCHTSPDQVPERLDRIRTESKLKTEYLTWMAPEEHASNCIKCGACEEACPQHLPIMQAMDEVVEAFGK